MLLPLYWFPAICVIFLCIAMTAVGLADAYREIEKAAKNGKANSGTIEKDSGKNT